MTEREQAGLRRQYEFQVRQKDLLLTPAGVAATSAGGGATAGMGGEETEGEKIHRYFGIALELNKEGRYEEASEILRYILALDPRDELARSYLERIRRDMSSQAMRWKKDAARDAQTMKRDRISTLLKDGTDYYRNEDYDRALVSFYDVLAIDPKNATALSYIQKLKSRYTQQARVEEIARSWEASRSGTAPDRAPAGIGAAADRLLESSAACAKSMPSEQSFQQKAFDRRVENLLEDVEFGETVDAIIANRRAENEPGSQLRLGPGDSLRLSILNHPEFSGEMVVQPGGEVILPLTGEPIMAQGLTLSELSNVIKARLEKYIQGPHVYISAMGYKSQVFYVVDDVSCTPYPITKPDLTLRDALFLSDWGNNRALGRVIVMTPSAHHPVIRKVDAFDLIFRGNLAHNIRIKNGDVIYVPMTFAAKVTKTIHDTLGPFRAIRNARNDYLDLKWNEQDWKSFFRMPPTYNQESGSITNNNAYTYGEMLNFGTGSSY